MAGGQLPPRFSGSPKGAAR